MRITRLAVRNYRSLESLDMDLNDYTALVGANGAGKSSVLYALDWFFRGSELEDSDITQRDGTPVATSIQVTVTFGDLTPWDRTRLGQYGRGDVARFRRTWSRGQKGTKVVGRALQGPGFGEVRQAGGITAVRAAWRALQQQVTGLPGLASNAPKDDILAALDEWEDRPDHSALLTEVDDVDASHMFGINGTNVIRDCVRLVLVPAATDMPSQLGDAAKGSALAELIGAVIADAGTRARDQWLTTHGDIIRDLNERVHRSVEQSVTAQADRINTRLKEMVPDARVTFVPDVPQWEPRSDASIATQVTIDGSTNDIGRQGHGVQRAVMIALFQSLVPDVPAPEASDEGPPDASEADGPSLVVCIEEPEIYQHPVRARSFARVLAELAGQPRAQVLVATHSPYFVSPSQFDSIRRFRIRGTRTAVSVASVEEVLTHTSVDAVAIRKFLQKRVPTTFSEGFFADAVVLVEGDTDRAVIESLAIRLGKPLDERGIALLELGGKTGLRVPHAIFSSLDVSAYIVADGDACGAQRRYPAADRAGDRDQADASSKKNTDTLISWLPSAACLQGSAPYKYGDPTIITDQYTIWHDDLESELEQWPSFIAALDQTGCKLRDKNALAYRTAILDAHLADLPATLRCAVDAVSAFG